MEKNELLQNAVAWFENEYHQTPYEHGYMVIKPRLKRVLLKRVKQIVFAFDEESFQAYDRAQNFIAQTYWVLLGVVFLLGVSAGVWLYLYCVLDMALNFYIWPALVVFGFMCMFLLLFLCYKVVSPLEKKYMNKIVVYTEVR